MPHPRVPLWLAPLLLVLSALPAIALIGATLLFLIGFVNALASSPQLLFQFMLVGLMLALLWYLVHAFAQVPAATPYPPVQPFPA